MKTNITRPIDTQYGYDLEIENSFTRADGYTSCAYLNGELIDTFYGVSAESDAKARLYSEVTHQINGGAQSVTASAPATYAELVEQREQAYIAQRDAENKLSDIKAALTASIASDPAYKNDAARKAELANRLQDYDTYVEQATKTADAYRKALAAIEVYQEAAKDARAKMRYETAQMELRAAELHLQAAQAKHDAAEPTDEDAYGDMPHQKPDAIKNDIIPNFETQHSWVLDVWNALSTIPSGDSAGYVARCFHDGRVRNELIINPDDGQVVVFENEGDCQDYCFSMRDKHGLGEWSVREVWYERPF